jgi:hypothetical protein
MKGSHLANVVRMASGEGFDETAEDFFCVLKLPVKAEICQGGPLWCGA